jgi:hypothetical protein
MRSGYSTPKHPSQSRPSRSIRKRLGRLNGIHREAASSRASPEEGASAYYAAGTAQYPIDADIAYAVMKYMEVTADTEFLHHEGAEILIETARMGDLQTENDAKRLDRFGFPVQADRNWQRMSPRCHDDRSSAGFMVGRKGQPAFYRECWQSCFARPATTLARKQRLSCYV